MGLELRNSRNLHGLVTEQQKVVGYENGKLIVEEIVREGGDEESGSTSKKRKFELDEEELMRIAREERQRKKIEISEEKVCFTMRLFICFANPKFSSLQKAASAIKLP